MTESPSLPPHPALTYQPPWRPSDVRRRVCRVHEKILRLGRRYVCPSCNHQWEAE